MAVPFALQHGARSQVRRTLGQRQGALSSILRRHRTVEQTLTLAVKVAQVVSLKPIRQNTKQQVAGQVWMRSTPEYGIPAAPKVTDVEIAQARNLDADCLAIRQNWTDLYACHDAQDDRPLDLRPGWLLSAPGI